MTDTPERYVPDERKVDDKNWLYEQYWGRQKSKVEVAQSCSVSHAVVGAKLHEHGIPTRVSSAKHKQFVDGVPVGFGVFTDEVDDEPSELTRDQTSEDTDPDWSAV